MEASNHLIKSKTVKRGTAGGGGTDDRKTDKPQATY